MPKDDATLSRTAIRRSDRAVTDDVWMKTLLERAPIGVLATVHDGQPFLNSNIFFYNQIEHAIYLHTARAGRTRSNIEMDARVCFTIYEMGRLLPAKTALEFSVEYASVVVFGTATRLNDPKEATTALHLLLRKYAPHLQAGKDYRPVIPVELARTSIYRICIEEWSGKQKVAPADFPGAYTYGG
jgi:nitroimidazol reductase NimA-like FMN-containing flavoprotein (pyridoxamine 5'-phosphate oxidase superfamily)